MAIELRPQPKTKIFAYRPDGTLLGEINDVEVLYDLQLQICEAKEDGWFLIWQGQKILIDKLGGLDSWPAGMADNGEVLFMKLLRARKEHYSTN